MLNLATEQTKAEIEALGGSAELLHLMFQSRRCRCALYGKTTPHDYVGIANNAGARQDTMMMWMQTVSGRYHWHTFNGFFYVTCRVLKDSNQTIW